MKKLKLKLDGMKEMLTKEQMKKISGGYSFSHGCGGWFGNCDQTGGGCASGEWETLCFESCCSGNAYKYCSFYDIEGSECTSFYIS